MVYVAFSRHLVFRIWLLVNVDAEFDANRAKIAVAMNSLLYIWKKPLKP